MRDPIDDAFARLESDIATQAQGPGVDHLAGAARRRQRTRLAGIVAGVVVLAGATGLLVENQTPNAVGPAVQGGSSSPSSHSVSTPPPTSPQDRETLNSVADELALIDVDRELTADDALGSSYPPSVASGYVSMHPDDASVLVRRMDTGDAVVDHESTGRSVASAIHYPWLVVLDRGLDGARPTLWRYDLRTGIRVDVTDASGAPAPAPDGERALLSVHDDWVIYESGDSCLTAVSLGRPYWPPEDGPWEVHCADDGWSISGLTTSEHDMLITEVRTDGAGSSGGVSCARLWRLPSVESPTELVDNPSGVASCDQQWAYEQNGTYLWQESATDLDDGEQPRLLAASGDGIPVELGRGSPAVACEGRFYWHSTEGGHWWDLAGGDVHDFEYEIAGIVDWRCSDGVLMVRDGGALRYQQPSAQYMERSLRRLELVDEVIATTPTDAELTSATPDELVRMVYRCVGGSCLRSGVGADPENVNYDELAEALRAARRGSGDLSVANIVESYVALSEDERTQIDVELFDAVFQGKL